MSFESKFKPIFFKKTSLKKLLPLCKDVFINWTIHFSSSPETSAYLLSQFLWFNKSIQIEDNPVYFVKCASKNINFLSQLFEEGNLKRWDDLKL